MFTKFQQDVDCPEDFSTRVRAGNGEISHAWCFQKKPSMTEETLGETLEETLR